MDVVITLSNALIENAPFLVGVVMPPIVELLNRDVKSETERYIVSVLLCFLAAILLHWREVEVGSPETVLAYATLIFMESQTVYRLYFKKSRIRGLMHEKLDIRREEESPVQ